ncbi:MAG TPA: hypothetical protein VIK33_17360 [Anaerolineae bacterium]
MTSPNHEKAVVPRKKIVDYLLSATHREGRGKARFSRVSVSQQMPGRLSRQH